MCSLAVIAIPFSRNITMFLVAVGVLGSSYGGIETAMGSWIIDLWKEKSNSYLQLMYLLGSVGNMLCPFISAPFLADEVQQSSLPDDILIRNEEILMDGNVTDIVVTVKMAAKPTSLLEIPYGACTAVLLGSVFVQIILYIKYRKISVIEDLEDDIKVKDIEKTDSSRRFSVYQGQGPADAESTQSRSYYWTVIVIGSLLFCFFVCVIDNTRNYLVAFVIHCPLKIPKTTGSLMLSAFTVSFTLTRLASVFIAAKIKASHMLITSFLLIAAGNVIILLSATNWSPGLWIGFVIIGAGCASCIGSLYAIIDERILVDSSVCGILMGASSFMTMISPIINGEVLETFPFIYVIINLSSISLCILLFFLLQATDCMKKKNCSESTDL
ncbi:Major facilitator superfamily domain-containing protein 4A [Halotydeus destructor]|nr:Major facilitator superfamily domain-containing protein 4A [Halotydeus destructor]